MNLKISYSKEADRFLKKNIDVLTEKEVEISIVSAVKKILKLEDTNINLKKLKGEYRGCFRIKNGDVRIIFSLKKEKFITAVIHDIDFRGNIYK
jgi:mRNA-degrading endonuclease RelE of RelBE toxin-antitoxin system